MPHTSGLHHVTAISGDPQRNVDFYEGFLGQRFVKRTVNFDDPSAYHLYYGDYIGSPGTAMTFFAWDGMSPTIPGSGAPNAVYYRIAPESVAFWYERAREYGVPVAKTTLFGEVALSMRDPDNLHLYLVADPNASRAVVRWWDDGPIPQDHQLRGLYGIRIGVQRIAMLAPVLVQAFGYEMGETDDQITRFSLPGPLGTHVDVEEMPDTLPAQQGVGAIHHVAVRARDDAEREVFRARLEALGLQPTGLIDRTFFHSTYVWTPARVLFEVATDTPGFTVNETADELGERLVLPAMHEPRRAQIESRLPLITLPRHDMARV